MNTSEDHSLIHQMYCELTNRKLELSMPMHFMWSAWKARGWTTADLELVVGHVKTLIKSGRRYPESLRLYNLIDPEKFIYDLSEARALARIPKVDNGKASVLRSANRPQETKPQPDNVKTPAQILRGEEGLRKLLKLRDEL